MSAASVSAASASDSPAIEPIRFDPAPIVLTFDFEEWFCICGDEHYSDPRNWAGFEPTIERSADRLLGRLSDAGVRGTFFVLGWIARRYPALVRRVAGEGHEIGFHGMTHRRCDELRPEELRRDFAEGKALLEDLAGVPVEGFRAPEWSVRRADDPVFEALAEEGYRYDASLTSIPLLGKPGNPPRAFAVTTPAGRVAEYPPLTGRGWGHTVHFGGGWAFRRLPWERIAAREEEFRREGSPAIFTFHPWEFDADPPPLPGASPLLRLTRTAHRRRLPRRFEKLLARGPFRRLGDLR
jgi:polysaccharide deacetylase family protein (PEP-CTERM system associated)